MLYILKSKKSKNLQPENSYARGTTMAFPIGWFLFDTDNTRANFWDSKDYIEFDGERYYYDKSLVFSNPIKAEIIYLRMKIEELKSSSFDFFMPTEFQKYINKYKKLSEEYPEYTI